MGWVGDVAYFIYVGCFPFIAAGAGLMLTFFIVFSMMSALVGLFRPPNKPMEQRL
jgi:hypothetical protein